MTIVNKTTLANAWLDTMFDTDFPAWSILELRTGAAPGPDNAATGTLACSITLPATPWAAAGTKSKGKNGTWSGTGVNGALAVAHYRLKNAADTKRIEGTVTVTSGGGDLTLDNVNTNTGQVVTINTFAYTL